MARFLAVDVDHDTLHLLTATVKGTQVKIEQAISFREAEPLTTANATQLGQRLREHLKDNEISAAPLVACVGRDRLILKDVKFPASVKSAEEPALVRFQTVKEITDGPDSVIIDYCPLPKQSSPNERHAVAVVVKKEVVQTYRQLAEAAGLKLIGLTARPFAASAGLEQAVQSGAVLGPERDDDALALLTRGERWGEFTVVKQGEVVFSRTLSNPALATERALIGELKRNLTVYAGQHPGEPIQALYVAEASGPTGWSGRVAHGVPVPVHTFDPLAGVPNEIEPSAHAHFAGLTGLVALHSRSRSALPVNFLSPREPAPERDPNQRLLLIVASIMGLLMIGGILYSLKVQSDLDAEVAVLQAQKSNLDRELGKLSNDRKRLDGVQEWQDREIVWLDELYDLVASFPDPKHARLKQWRGVPMLRTSNRNRNRRPATESQRAYVASSEIEVATDRSERAVELMMELTQDDHYAVGPRGSRTSPRGRSSNLRLEYTLKWQIKPRPPEEYVRALPVVVNAEDDQDQQDDAMNPFNRFGGGGFGGGGFGMGGNFAPGGGR